MKSKKFIAASGLSAIALASMANADTFTEALTQGKASGDIRIRYESVDQDNMLEDASALTIRSRIGYTTGETNGFLALVEFEDVRVVAGIDDYSVPPTGFQTGQYSVIADPEVTELDQGFLQYKSGIFSAKLGRQVVTYDNHRFVGHVGWRQDRQTFDGIAFNLKPDDDLSLSYNYLTQRNRIFAEVADLKSKDHLLNAAYKTPVGTLTGYAYLLEIDDAPDNSLDTVGVRFSGAKEKFSYGVEFASQTVESIGSEFDANYLMGELAYDFGPVKLTGTYELLGSDNGAYGFQTPLATLHKFNGWVDQFLNTPASGLQDISISIGGKGGPGTWQVVYHDFSADDSTGPVDDLGDEIDAVYSMKFAKHYNFGVKGGIYSAGDNGSGRVDTSKFWLWVGASF